MLEYYTQITDIIDEKLIDYYENVIQYPVNLDAIQYKICDHERHTTNVLAVGVHKCECNSTNLCYDTFYNAIIRDIDSGHAINIACILSKYPNEFRKACVVNHKLHFRINNAISRLENLLNDQFKDIKALLDNVITGD